MNKIMSEETKTPEVKMDSELSPEELTAQTENEDFILNFSEEDSQDPDKVEKLNELLKDAKTTIHQKRHYRSKFEEATKPPETPEVPKPEVPKTPETPAVPATPVTPEDGVDPVKKITFRQDHPELPKEVAEQIFAHADAYKIDPEEALKSDLIQNYIENTKNSADVVDASIPPGGAPGSEVGKKDWSTASQTDVEAQRNKILNPGS